MTSPYPRGHWKETGPRQKLIHEKCGQVIADWPTDRIEQDALAVQAIKDGHSRWCKGEKS